MVGEWHRRPDSLNLDRHATNRHASRGTGLMADHTLILEADDVRDACHWYWRLKDPNGATLADHEVELDPADWQYQAFLDLYGYLVHHVAPDRWEQEETRLVPQVGEWIGDQVLGPRGAGDPRLRDARHGTGGDPPRDGGRGGSAIPAPGAGLRRRPAAGGAGREPGLRGPGRSPARRPAARGRAPADAGRLQPADRPSRPEPAGTSATSSSSWSARLPSGTGWPSTCECSSTV